MKVEVQSLLEETWGIKGGITKLAGYEDQNFLVQTDDEKYLLKISNGPLDDFLRAQGKVMESMGDKVSILEKENHTIRLLPWKEGDVWAKHRPQTGELLSDLGKKAALHYEALEDFDDPAIHRKGFQWDLANAQWIKEDLNQLEESLVPIVEYFLTAYIDLQPLYYTLPKSAIHNDLNDYNIIVKEGKVAGFIDYGDMCYSQRINEVAILLAYAMMNKVDPLDSAVPVLKGFTSICALEKEEIDCLFVLIAMRLCVSIVSSQKALARHPDNEYLLISRQPAIQLLQQLFKINKSFATYKFRAACGIEIKDAKSFEQWISMNEIAKVCDYDSKEYYTLDLGVGSTELGHEAYYNDPIRHHEEIAKILHSTGKSLAIGCYNEVRPLYSSDDFTEIGNEGQRWRTVHIGLDFFKEAGTEVYAFADGKVHAVNYNEGDKNYGYTVILQHENFYTLYGHLSSETTKHLAVGQTVKAGDHIAWFGERYENGNWAPHLHFQIILDMMGYEGDFPGVCYIEDREIWTALCPDPSPLLGIKSLPEKGLSAAEIKKKRSVNIGRSYSLSYSEPLHIVRAHGAYLYDTTGRKYLDCVNNVPHVGHQNIRVVEAATKQMQLLNTNTRYLHEHIVELAEKLAATLPDHLTVCHFVNSGSEANELALRMARIKTGRHGIVAMEHGYHGNTGLCVDISSYKFNGRGGQGKKDFVQLVQMPDPVRGNDYRDFEFDLNASPAAAFIHESILSCGGQVVMPSHFFSDLYGTFRKEGMVMIADEVQTGLGRIGSHMWAFEAEGLTPDIVTIGKPFGNGHPLAAVVCTEEIADAFHNGMEYFNTFGGNPVSCMIGLEVLKVIEDEGLQKHALDLGQFLTQKLKVLQEKHDVIADVRGRGLFLGWEFADPKTNAPLAKTASFFVNEMKRYGILLSTDGPLHNVVKLKPPMVFSKVNATYLLETMARVLEYV